MNHEPTCSYCGADPGDDKTIAYVRGKNIIVCGRQRCLRALKRDERDGGQETDELHAEFD